MVREFASGLLQLGVTKDETICYFAENSLHHTIAWFSGLYLGSPVLLQISPNDRSTISFQIRDAKSTILIIGLSKVIDFQQILFDDKKRSHLTHLKLIILLNSKQKDEILLRDLVKQWLSNSPIVHTSATVTELGKPKPLVSIPHFPVKNPKNKHLGIYYTSGTSNMPKGVIHTHGSFIASLLNWKFPDNHIEKRVITCQPLGHLSGSHFIPMCLDQCMTVICLSNERTSIDEIMENIYKFRINFYIFTGHASPLLLKDYEKLYDLTCLEGIHLGGTKFDKKTLLNIKAKYQVRMYETYASTEFAGHIGFMDQSKTWQDYEPGNLGTVQPNIEMKIIDLESGRSLPANQNGEVCFRGPPCFVGYLKNEPETKKAIDSDEWYHSGDIGYYNDQKCLFIIDRINQMISWHPTSTVFFHFLPGELEQFIKEHPAVLDVCVVGVPHITYGNLTRAYIQLKPGISICEQEMVDYINRKLLQ